VKNEIAEKSSALVNFLQTVRNFPRALKRIIMVAYDAAALFGLAWLFASLITQDAATRLNAALAAVGIGIFFIFMAGGYTAVVRFMGRYAGAVFAIGVVGASLAWSWQVQLVPFAVLFCSAGFVLLFAPRIALREMDLHTHRANFVITRIAIYGAGKAGRQLAWSLRADPRYRAVLFIDDSPDLQGTRVQGIKVFSPTKLPMLLRRHRIEQVFYAIPSATHERRTAILASLAEQAIKVQAVPELHEIIDGNVSPAQLRFIEMEDILDRDPVPADPVLLRFTIENKVVLISGAGGSIGSELCRTILKLRPRTLVLLEMSEPALYQIEQELLTLTSQMPGTPPELIPILGNVLDSRAVDAAFSLRKVNTVFHAAAYKHVPLLETNVIEGVRNNIFGTQIMVERALAHKVTTFVMVSTDKAVRPTNVMGATKRVAEMIVQSYGHGSDCQFSIVRFGNVLGSSGSVLPMFHAQIAKGGPITVTHPEITRFFMTIPEAAQLVIQTGALGGQGDVYHLDMGKPVKIIDLARRLLNLYGLHERTLENDNGVEISIIGLRPGEKLYEELLIDNTARSTTHPRIFVARERFPSRSELVAHLNQLRQACSEGNDELAIECLESAVEGFKPYPRQSYSERASDGIPTTAQANHKFIN
jgi:FlaA1/EpsC-like NDP-sugar epimerase